MKPSKSTIWFFFFFLSRLSKEKTLHWKKGQGTVPDMRVLSKAIPQGSPLSIGQRNLFHLPRKRKRETEEGGKTITPCIQSVALAWGVDSLVLPLWTAVALTDQMGYTVWLNWNITRDKLWHNALRTLTKLYVVAVLLQNVKSSNILTLHLTVMNNLMWGGVIGKKYMLFWILRVLMKVEAGSRCNSSTCLHTDTIP